MGTSEAQSTQLTVIGAGPGGYAAAFLAADLGMDVTLVDPEPNPGGVCLYRGCIPSKALLHVAKLLREAKDAERWGISFGEPNVDLDRLRAWKEEVVSTLTSGLGQLRKQRKVSYIQGRAIFRDARTLQVSRVDGREERLSFGHAIVATGSSPIRLPGLMPESTRVMDSTGALELRDVPESLLVVGGGYIGLEMGTVYAALGTRVTVVEMLPTILPGADRDLVRILAKRLKERFDTILLNTRVVGMTEVGERIRVKLEGKEEVESEQEFDRVLVSIGRRPNSAGLGLENTGVAIDERGFVKVDAQRRTAEPTIYAIGDLVGEPMLAHKASHEGRTAVEAIAGHKVAFEPRAIPAVVFTDPEVAWCGVTETEAKERGLDIQVARFPWAASGRALTMDRTDGMTKMVIDGKTERLLGVGIVGAGAGELIAEATLALEMAAVATDVRLTIHAHPTLSETIMEAADSLLGQSTHYYRPRRR